MFSENPWAVQINLQSTDEEVSHSREQTELNESDVV